MIQLSFQAFDPGDWQNRAESMPDLSLLQTWAYGEAKKGSSSWNVERAAIFNDGNEIGLVQAFVRKVPLLGGGLVWINRGPLLREPARRDDRIWQQMLEVMRQRWVVERRMILRIAPPLGVSIPVGFQSAGEDGYHSARLDLHQPIETLRKNLDRKWRNHLNKAERAELRIESGADENLVADAISDYAAMLARKRFHTGVSPELLVQLQRALPPEKKMWSIIARDPAGIAGFVLMARYGDVAEYLSGSSNPLGRKSNAGHLLVWQAIVEMKQQGYRWFDVGGSDPTRTAPGVYEFKNGLQAERYALPVEIEAYNGDPISFAVRTIVRRARMRDHQ
jgi:hypothetical protein